MESKSATGDQEMLEIRSKVLASTNAESQVPPVRTSSIEGSSKRIIPRGPKEQAGSPVQDPKEHPIKTGSKESPRSVPGSTNAANPERRTRPHRSSSMDAGGAGSGSKGVSSDAVTSPDDFLIIDRPPNVLLKGEPTTSGGGAVDSNKEPSQSLLAKLTGPRRGDPRTWPHEALAELQRREEMYHQMRAYIDKLEERIQSQDHEISALNTALADTEHKLDLTRQDLNASRAFVSSEGTGDAQHLIKSLRELNSSIDDFAFRLMQEVLPEAATSRTTTKAGLEGLHKAYPAVAKIATFVNTAFRVQASIGDFVHPFVCHSLCLWVNDLVFTPFVPGLDKERSRIFHEIYELVHENEPQERSARWRAITYAHADTRRNDKFFCEKAGDEFLLKMATALTPLIAPETITFETLKSELGDVVRAVFEEAVKLQDKAKTGYMSFDYAPFMPNIDQPFVPLYMNTADACADVRQGGKGKSSHAILVVGLGMQAWKSVVKEDKTLGRDTTIAVKSTVICGNWNPNA